jgi:Yip1 domain
MSTSFDPGPQVSGLVARAKALLFSPKDEWPKIAASSESISDIFRSWVLPLAAIGPVATFIGGQLFGHGAFGFSYKPSFMGGLSTAVISYGLGLLSVYVMALVIDWLAPNFGATPNRTAAYKVAAFGATAAWIAGIFGIFPSLGWLSILGLYSLYLVFLGLPFLMKAPAEKAAGYTVVTIVIMFVVAIVSSFLTAKLSGSFFGGAASIGAASGTVTVPGGGTVDMGKLEEAGKKLEEATAKMQSGEGKPAIAVDVLQGLLPTIVGGMSRASVESSSVGAAGMGGAQAEARYGSGDNVITLTVTDMGPIGGLASLGSALNVQSSKQDGTSYEKIGKVDGRMTTEKFDSAEKRGEYSTIVGDRIMVQAEGNAASIDVLKEAVASVDLDKVAALAAKQ